jgi:hypothetical protein
MRGVRIALASGLALLGFAIVLTLWGSPTVAPSRPFVHETELATVEHNSSACQGGETLPRGTTAIASRCRP